MGLWIGNYPAAAQNIVFEREFGKLNVGDYARGIVQLPNGDIYVLGNENNGLLGGADMTLTKFSETGDSLWTRYYGTSSNDYAAALALHPDGERLVFCGSYELVVPNTDGIIITTDLAGNVLQTIFTQPSVLTEQLESLVIMPDGSIVVGGFRSEDSGASNDFWFLRYDTSGNLMWKRTHGGIGNDVVNKIRISPDGNIVFVGDTQSFSADGNVDIFVGKLSATNGGLLWQNIQGDEWANGTKSLIVTQNGDYFICGETIIDNTFKFNIVLMRVNDNGELLYYTTWGGAGTEAGFNAVELPNSDILIVGYSNSHAPSSPINIVALQVDNLGNPLEVHYFTYPELAIGYDLCPALTPQHYLIAGRRNLNGIAQGYIAEITTPLTFSTAVAASTKPIPSQMQLNYTATSPWGELQWQSASTGECRLSVYNIAGQLQYTTSLMAFEGDNTCFVPVNNWLVGTYVFLLEQLKNNNQSTIWHKY